jgi:LCP family protein required for cell wall assembly
MNGNDKYVIYDEPPRSNGGPGKGQPPRGKKSKAFKALVAIFIALVTTLVVLVAVYVLVPLAKIYDKGFDVGSNVSDEIETGDVSGLPSAQDQDANVTGIEKNKNEVDILMIGVDNRENKFTGRSDVMMYLRVNTEKKTIKLVSFMRDTLVSIDGHKKNRLNTAYYFGGVDLMFSTYHDRFGLDPDYYIVVNFYGMEDIINAMDGVDVDIDSNELEWLNVNINEINSETSGADAPNINKSGTHHLSGRQAVAYMRIRHPGGDAGRIARQQLVMYKLFSKAQNVSAGQIPDLITTLSQYVRTDIPVDVMLDLASSIRGMSKDNVITFRYPDSYENVNYNGADVVQPKNFEEEYTKLYNFLNG